MDILDSITGQTGEALALPQWESGNMGSAFPFADDAVPEGFPLHAVVDACVCVTRFQDTGPFWDATLSCLHCGGPGGIVSAVVSVAGVPVLRCVVPAGSFEPFAPVAMEYVGVGLPDDVASVSGSISFGDVLDGPEPLRGTWRMDVPLAPSAIVCPVVGRLARFTESWRGAEATGDVGVLLPDGAGMSLFEEDGSDVSTVLFSLSGSAREDVLDTCAAAAGVASSHAPVPILSINGVRPDEQGRIAVVFTSDRSEVPA